MNPGLAIFKKRQRLQGGTNEVRDKIPPFFENGKWWWERSDDEQGHVPLRPMSEMPENEEDLSPEELRREQEDYKRRLRESKYIQAQGGTSSVQHFQGGTNGVNKFTEQELAQFPEWLRDIMRTMPEKPIRKGKGQFDPRDVPIVPFDPAGNRAFDPELGRDDLMLMAQKGMAEVPGLQRGTERFMGPGAGDPRTAATTIGKWGDILGPSSVAVSPADIASGRYQPGQWIYTSRGWKQVQDTSYVSPGKPNPAGTIEYWLPKGGGQARYRGAGISPARYGGGWKYKGNLSGPGSRQGLGIQYQETPESDLGYGYSPSTPFGSGMPGWFKPGVAGGTAPPGQVIVGGGGGFAPGVYTGELGGPGDPGNPPSVGGRGGIPVPPVGEGSGISGGPFQGWSPQEFSGWHSGAGLAQSGAPSFEGQTAGQGGTPLAYQTTSYYDPQYGWVPQAQLANAQASNNPLDYLNPFGNTTQGGPGTGVPTQKAIGTTVGTLSNFVIPGLGFLTGPLARYATNLLQHGFSQQQVQQAVQKVKDLGGDVPPMPSGSVDLPTHGSYDLGAGANPMGNPTTGRQWYSSDFGRAPGMSPGNYNNPLTPGGGPGTFGTGFGTGTVGNFATAIGFDRLGAGQGSTNLSAMGGGPAASQMRQITKGIYTPMTGYGYGPLSGFTGTQAPSAQANIAGQQQLHDILMANPGALSGPISGNITRGVPMKQSVQMGSSNITQNPGLRLFMAGQGLRKPKPKKPKL